MDARLQAILDYYGGSGSGNQILIKCPSHDDNKPSCSVSILDDGIAPNCFSGCNAKEVWAQIKSDIPHLFPPPKSSGMIAKKNIKRFFDQQPPDMDEIPKEFQKKGSPGLYHTEMRYQYLNKHGNPTGFYVYRAIHTENGSKVTPGLSAVEDNDGNIGWSWCRPPDVQIYGLDQMVRADADKKPVIIVEGEKCVSAARKHFGDRYVILTWSGGSSTYHKPNWKKEIDWHPPYIYLWPDKDVPGQKWAINGSFDQPPLWEVLRKQGHRVRIVNPWDDDRIPDNGWDIADCLEMGRDPELFITNSVNPDVFVLGDVYSRCAVAKRNELKIDELNTVSCGTKPECAQCHLSYVNLVSKPSDIQKYGGSLFMIDCAYMQSADAFYDLREDKSLPTKNWNATKKHIALGIGDGKQSASDIFLSRSDTLQIFNRTFKPGHSRIIKEGAYNLLNHWDVATLHPIPDISFVEKWMDLCEYLIPDQETRDHFLDWIAFTIQHPEKKINHQILFMSPNEGVGKDSLFEPLHLYFQDHAPNMTTSELMERFNGKLGQAKLLMIAELSSRGVGKRAAEKLKPLAASQAANTIAIERKGENIYDIPNLLSIVAMSNDDVPLFINDKDRRWFVIKSDVKPKDETWFVDYHSHLSNDAQEHMLSPAATAIIQHLRTRNISGFNYGGRAPMTAAKAELIEFGNPWESLVKQAIEEEVYPFNKDIVSSAEIKLYCEMNLNNVAANHLTRNKNIFTPAVVGKTKNSISVPSDLRSRIKDNPKNLMLYIVRNVDAWRQKGNRELVIGWMDKSSLAGNLYGINETNAQDDT